MSIWRTPPDIDVINAHSPDTLVSRLGIRFTEVGDDHLTATMPVDARTRQPLGLLHGGASVALAETLGSVGSLCCIDPATATCVGLEINANHLRAIREGVATGTARPLHLGRTTHVWDIRITDEAERMICVSRITMAILQR